jgi:hypothetical protein
MRGLSAVVLALFLGGCAFGAVAPSYIKCKGKGTFSATGSLGGGMIYGGGGTNTATVMADCGDGLEFEQGKAPAPAPTPSAPTK